MLKCKHSNPDRIADKMDDIIKDAEIRAQFEALSQKNLLIVLTSTTHPKKEIFQYLMTKYHLSKKQIEHIVYDKTLSV